MNKLFFVVGFVISSFLLYVPRAFSQECDSVNFMVNEDGNCINLDNLITGSSTPASITSWPPEQFNPELNPLSELSPLGQADQMLGGCIGPWETMETTGTLFAIDLSVSSSGSIDHWSKAEQDFLMDFRQQFWMQCMEMEDPLSPEELQSGLFDLDGNQNLIDSVKPICDGKTAGHGTNWDRFVASLPTFPALCQ